MPNSTGRATSASSSGFCGQEDLVDEVEVFDALRDQAVDLLEQRREVAAAIVVAEIDLGAERAMVGAAARGLDLGAGPLRLAVEAVMVVGWRADPLVAASAGPAGR